eukprot:5241926-Amphidinium_carterae.3
MRAVSSIPKPDHDEIADRLHAKVVSSVRCAPTTIGAQWRVLPARAEQLRTAVFSLSSSKQGNTHYKLSPLGLPRDVARDTQQTHEECVWR